MEDETATAASAPPAATVSTTPPKPAKMRRRRGSSAAAMVLQVALIAIGVFLGLAGEEWREDRENRRLATDTLSRFRTEIAGNRDTVLGVKDYHAELYANLNAYFAANEEERANSSVGFAGIRIPRFDSTAWDLALATGTLAYLDTELAFSLSRVYGVQGMANQLAGRLADAIYLHPPKVEPEAFLQSLELYYDDLTDIEDELVPAYDTLLKALDEALAR